MNKTWCMHSRNLQSSEDRNIGFLASGSWNKLWDNDWQEEEGALGIAWRGMEPCSPSGKHRLFFLAMSPACLLPPSPALPLFLPVESGCSD